jgi:histidine triad (HIT) family protein
VSEDCLFCKIVAGEIPSQQVASTDDVYAFRDINPAAPTHVLVIPKEHIVSAADVGSEHGPLIAEIFQVARQVARDEGIGDAYRLVSNVGAGAGQSVFHLHFHVIGGRELSWPPG